MSSETSLGPMIETLTTIKDDLCKLAEYEGAARVREAREYLMSLVPSPAKAEAKPEAGVNVTDKQVKGVIDAITTRTDQINEQNKSEYANEWADKIEAWRHSNSRQYDDTGLIDIIRQLRLVQRSSIHAPIPSPAVCECPTCSDHRRTDFAERPSPTPSPAGEAKCDNGNLNGRRCGTCPACTQARVKEPAGEADSIDSIEKVAKELVSWIPLTFEQGSGLDQIHTFAARLRALAAKHEKEITTLEEYNTVATPTQDAEAAHAQWIAATRDLTGIAAVCVFTDEGIRDYLRKVFASPQAAEVADELSNWWTDSYPSQPLRQAAFDVLLLKVRRLQPTREMPEAVERLIRIVRELSSPGVYGDEIAAVRASFTPATAPDAVPVVNSGADHFARGAIQSIMDRVDKLETKVFGKK